MELSRTCRLLRLMLIPVVAAIGILQGRGIARSADAASDTDHDVSEQVVRLTGPSGVCASFSPDGDHILTAGGNEARVWDGKTFNPVIDPIRHEDLYFAAFSPDGKKVVTCGIRTARLWDAKTGKELLPPLKHAVPVNGDGVVHMAAFSPDGSKLATACGDGKARIWDVSDGRELVDPMELSRGGPVLSVAFSPDGKQLLALDDRRAQLRDAASGTLIAPLLHGPDSTYCAAFSPDGKRVATGHSEGLVVVWDAQTGKQLVGARKNDQTIVSIAFSPDGIRLVTADRHVRVWDANTAKPITPSLGDGVTDYNKALFSPDGKTILGIGANGVATATLWDAVTGLELMQLSHCQSLGAAAFSPNGNMIVMGCYWEGYTCVWSRASGKSK